MQYSGRPRRFRRIHTAYAKAQGYTTAAEMLTGVVGGELAERYAAPITRAAQNLGTSANATVFVKRGGRARAAAAYDLSRDAVNLLLVLATYRPSLAATVTKTGKESKSKAAQAQRTAHAAYVKAFRAGAAA